MALAPAHPAAELEPVRSGIQPDALLELARVADPPIERDLPAQRVLHGHLHPLGRRALGAGLVVVGLELPGVERGRPVLVELEIRRPRERLAPVGEP